MQRARRHDPYPWTWEIPLLVFVLLMLVLAVGVQVGRGLANLISGAGVTWPVDQAAFWRSLTAVAAGDAGAGLAPAQADTGLASPALLWVGVGLTETLLLVGVGWVTVWGLRRWGPGRLRGMATRPEAEHLLGLTRLRKVSGIVRPDLYGRPSALTADGSTQRDPTSRHDDHAHVDPVAKPAPPGREFGGRLPGRFLPERARAIGRGRS